MAMSNQSRPSTRVGLAVLYLLIGCLTTASAPAFEQPVDPVSIRTAVAGQPATPAIAPHARLLFSRDGDPQRTHLPFTDRSIDDPTVNDSPALDLDAEQLARIAELKNPAVLRRPNEHAAAKTTAGGRAAPIDAFRTAPEKDAPWSSNLLLANPTNMNDEHIALAENPVTGHLFAVFAATDLGGTDRDIHVARSTDGGLTWNVREMPASSYDEYHPDLAFDAVGYLHVVWVRSDGSLMRARSAAPDDHTVWTNVFSFLVGEPLAIPSLAVSGSGDFAKLFIGVDWQTVNYDFMAYEWTLLFLHSTNGGLTMNYDYFLPDGYEDLWPVVAMDGGTVHFANAEVDLYTGETEILIATDNYAGGFAEPALLTDWTPNNCGFPDIACENDDVFIVYQHDFVDGLTTDGDIIYCYSWDAGATFYGPIGMMADEYESVGPSVFTRGGVVGCLWLDAPAGGDEFSLAGRLGGGHGHTDLMGGVEIVSDLATVEPTYRSCAGVGAPGGLHAAWIDRRDYPTQGHNVYTSSRALVGNLVDYTPADWDASLVASMIAGERGDGWLAANEPAYVSFAFLNGGLADIADSFDVELRLDNRIVAAWTVSGLPTSTYVPVEDFEITADAGAHTLTVTLDPGAVVAESDEADNSFSRTLTWIEGEPQLRLNPGHLLHTILPAASKSAARQLVDEPLLRREVHLPVVDTPLATAADAAASNDFLRVMIVPAERLDPDAMSAALQGAARTTRREVLLDAARTQSDRSWQLLRPELDRLGADGRLDAAQPLWLPGMISARLTPAAIQELAEHPEIGHLWLDDQPSRSFGLPTGGIGPAVEKAVPWHLSAIQAESAWADGVTGAGVVVGHLDTGIAYDHPDLAGRMWDGGAAYPNHGFDSVDEDGDPYDGDTYYHGTHTAGLIAGDGSGGTATGAAPGATLMALRSVPGYLADLNECLQFGIDHGVDLFSYSGGWTQPTEALRVANRYTAEMLLALEIPWICAAGNGDNLGGHNPVPGDLASPADCPSAWSAPDGGGTAVLAVGAVTSTLGVWDGSSYGPVEWNADNPHGATDYHDYPWQPGLPKPEIAAPGDGVRSCTGSSGYVTYSGTSMACPLVAGTACLLLSEAPSLNVEQLYETLESTASDISTSPAAPGRDNYTGAGLVNVVAARNHLPSAQAARFWVCNDGELPLVLENVVDSAPWLEVPPPERAIDPGDSVRLTALIDPSSLFEGFHQAQVIFVSNDPVTAHVLPVTLIYGEGLSPVEEPTPARAAASLTNRPNPFNPRTLLHFSTDRSGPVRLDIFDLRGRLVRRLIDESLPAGGHEAAWDGRDDGGRGASSGQYYARLRAAGSEPVTRKMTLLR